MLGAVRYSELKSKLTAIVLEDFIKASNKRSKSKMLSEVRPSVLGCL